MKREEKEALVGALKKLKSGKAPCLERTAVDMLKYSRGSIIKGFLKILKLSIEINIVPKGRKIVCIILIQTSGRDRSRGISLLSIPEKLCGRVLNSRLAERT